MKPHFSKEPYDEEDGEVDISADEGTTSSSSDEDEDACELTEEIEKKFFKTLSCIKKKDPQIYDKDSRFFDKVPEIDEQLLKEKRKRKDVDTPLTLKKYQLNMLTNGVEEETTADFMGEGSWKSTDTKKPYVQEQLELKEGFAKFLKDDSDDDEAEIGGLFREQRKSKSEVEKEDADYKEWLKGQRKQLEDKQMEGDMRFLHDYWNNPDLDQDEKFLKDYILNKRFLEKPIKEEKFDLDPVMLEEDEEILDTQSHFEHKYNFRFEEPDQEFIKRYPRVMENSARTKDNRRKLKRDAAKARKEEEKEEKRKELKKLKAAKFKEIEEKLRAIKEATGNEQLAFKDEDIEKEFDPSEHDVQMQKLFSDEFYSHEESDKPMFKDDLDLDKYGDDENEEEFQDNENYNFENNDDDDDLIMDCDYSPEKAMLAKKLKAENRKNRKNKKRGVSAEESLGESSKAARPVFDKKLHKTFQNYLDEYYSLDCEDFIGDLACRFKYRQVVPNNFGLSVEEILAADDKELEKWCALQKIKQFRSREVEVNEVKVYARKAENEELKKKILPSLFKSEEPAENEGDCADEAPIENKKKKKRKKKKKKKNVNVGGVDSVSVGANESQEKTSENVGDKSRKRKHEVVGEEQLDTTNPGACTSSTKAAKKLKVKHEEHLIAQNEVKKKSSELISNSSSEKVKNHKKLKNKNKGRVMNQENVSGDKDVSDKGLKSLYNVISDERLKAYGIKPKKFRNKFRIKK